MGEVYRAKDTRLGREVAVKVLPAAFAADKERLTRFRREAQTLASLNHPHIAAIYGLEEVDGTLALALELVEGEDLEQRLTRGAVPIDEAVAIAKQIAQGLEAAHEKGIVHRDLKPANVKLSSDGDVKVLDFGLAKALEGDAPGDSGLTHSPTISRHMTEGGVILGTAAYMSPEQARGKSVDKRTDIWAFGVVLYEMLTGRRLFDGETVTDVLAGVLTKESDWSLLPADTPQAVRGLLARCLQRDPKLRLRDIGEARIALAEPVREEPRPEAVRTGRTGIAGPLVALGVLAAISAGFLAGWALRTGLHKPVSAEPVRLHALTFSGKDDEPSASPDGKLLSFASWRDGVSRIWVKQLAGGGEAPLTSGPDRSPRFSPDGSNVLFLRQAGSIQSVYRVGLVGGEPRKLIDDATEADWSPDGRRIVFVRTPPGEEQVCSVGVYDLQNDKETILSSSRESLVLSARWSPDGKEILLATTGARNRNAVSWRLSALDVASGKITPVPPGVPGNPLGGLAWSGAGREFFFVQTANLLSDLAGAGSRCYRCDAVTGEREALFWADGLATINASVGGVTRCDVLGPGQLVFSQRLRRQNLREVALRGAAGGSPRLLTDGSSIDRQPTYSPDGRTVLFSSNRSGNLDLWSLDVASGVLRQITDDRAQDWDPAFSPDGKHILWSCDRGGHLEIWRANADGSGARQVTQDGEDAENPTETRDGGWIIYWSGSGEKRGIWKIHPDGSGASRLAESGLGSDVSPDGRTILYFEQNQVDFQNTLKFIDVETGKVIRFTVSVPYRLGSPAIIWGRGRWAPDGKSIYYIGEDEHGLSGVYQQDFVPGKDTSATRRPAAGFSMEFVTESLGVSPDGARITISTGQESDTILVADHVPGALQPVRRVP